MTHNSEHSSQESRSTRSDGQSAKPTSFIDAGIAAGSALCLYAFANGKKTGAALAAAGVIALTYERQSASSKSYEAKASFAIDCSPETAYNFWHDIQNLPRFMQYLESVKVTGENRSEWKALGPLGVKLQWTAEITEDRENERISWRSVPGSQVETSGSVEFLPGANGRGTLATARVEYVLPGGAAVKAFASIMGKDPQFTVREDLRRFKALIETGEVPTTKGQSHGPRGLQGRAQEALLREQQNNPPSQLRQPMRTAV